MAVIEFTYDTFDL